MRKLFSAGTVALALATALPGHLTAQHTMMEKSLYDRLGGKPAITAVVDEFVARVAADQRINGFFAAAASDPMRLAAFKGKLVDQICAASGGPCTYTGKDMKTAHTDMGIQTADFNAVVENLQHAMDAEGVPFRTQNKVLAKLAPMKRKIVER